MEGDRVVEAAGTESNVVMGDRVRQATLRVAGAIFSPPVEREEVYGLEEGSGEEGEEGSDAEETGTREDGYDSTHRGALM